MKSVLLGLAGLLVVSMVHGQEPEAGVSVSRSVRQKINTKPIFEAARSSAAKKQNTSEVSVETTFNQIRAIQFVQSKAEFLPDAQPALEQLAAFMRDAPTIEIELAGHTDNQGDFDQNVLLSRKRVELVKDYLVQTGIAAKRIVTRGYGPTRPIASNKTEATRQLNRRVEILVMKQ